VNSGPLAKKFRTLLWSQPKSTTAFPTWLNV